MSNRKMLINYVPGQECRVACVDDGRLEEFHTERAGSVNVIGNIYSGTVTNVEAGIQAAFVDFGHDVNGFLHVSDLHPQYFPGESEETKEQIGKKTPRKERPPIQRCLKRGQKVIVQVLKESINSKGPTLTTYLSIPGRYLVMLPHMDKVGVSRKVEDDEDRRSMRDVLDAMDLPEDFGFIMRTAGAGKGRTEIKRDLAYLQRLWKDIDRRRNIKGGARLLYAESDLLMRCLRDIWTSDIDEIIIDHEASIRRAARFMKIVSPRSSTKLMRYNERTPLFHAYGIEEQIARIHAREVPLPSGGSLVIDETEALIAIDVNSGKMRDKGDAETTAYKTNQEAVDEICRQLRMRDIGGLVVCDLIDMHSRGNRRSIESRMRDRLKKDRAATRALPISRFGMVEMTRQRVRGSMRDVHFAKCPSCAGKGYLQRPESVVTSLLRDLAAMLEQDRIYKVEIVVSARVASELLSARRQTLSRLELTSRKHIDVRVVESVPVDRVAVYAYDDKGADIDLSRLPTPRPPKSLKPWEEKAATGKDWSVDIHAEQSRMDDELQQFESELDGVEADETDDPFLSDDVDVETPADEEETGGKRKRRRRRRRRSKRSKSEGAEENAGEDRSSDERESKSSDDAEDAASDAGGDESGSGEGRKKRRRRRRRRRKTSGDAEASGGGDSNESSDDSSAKTPESPDEDSPADEKPADEAPEETPSDDGLRGDSWDLTPEELDKRRSGGKKSKSKKKTTRKKSAPRKTMADVEAEVEAESKADAKAKAKADAEAEANADADADADADAEAQAPEDDATPTTKKKSRRKRGGRSRSKSKGDEGDGASAPKEAAAAPEDDAAPAEDKGGSKKKTTKKKTRRTTKKKTTAKTAKADGRGKDDDAPSLKGAEDVAATVKAVKPKRVLYSSRRRVSPAQAKMLREEKGD